MTDIPEPSAEDMEMDLEWYCRNDACGLGYYSTAIRRAYHAERKLAELQAEMRSHVCDAAPKLAALEKRIADARRGMFCRLHGFNACSWDCRENNDAFDAIILRVEEL